MLRWLTDDWNHLLGRPWATLALAGAAVLGGALVGVERERKGKVVGFRTLILVCVGSMVFTTLSGIFSNERGEAARNVAAQIVSGVGFLGGGAILRSGFNVTGLTSAATIWAMAAVGMTAGAGYGGGALGVSVLILAVLTVISAAEQRWLGPCGFVETTVVFDPDHGKGRVRVEQVLDDYRVLPANRRSGAGASADAAAAGWETVRLRYCHTHPHHKEFLAQLAELPVVKEIRPETSDGGPGATSERALRGTFLFPRQDA